MAQAAPTDTPPIKLGGVALNVTDLQRSEKFYTEVIGLAVAIRVPPDGPTKEIALCVSGSLTGGDPFLVLANLGKPIAPGRAGFGRVIVNTTDAQAIAHRATTAGYVAEALSPPGADRPVYFLTDPDDYRVELYQASAAEAKY